MLPKLLGGNKLRCFVNNEFKEMLSRKQNTFIVNIVDIELFNTKHVYSSAFSVRRKRFLVEALHGANV